MPARFLDAQLPVESTDLPTHPHAPAGFSNVSIFKCENVLKNESLGPLDALPDLQIRTNRRLYRAAMSWTDYNIGRILAELERLGYANNTVVSFLGDHG